jgi:prepilin-type N-terminal cleavage/methylation domain-containing protein
MFKPYKNIQESGFSLIEISIALMVVAVGMLGVLSMFPVGLEQNERSINETYGALFAQEVFAGLNAYAETNWINLEDFRAPLSVDHFVSPHIVTNIIRCTTPDKVLTNKYMHATNMVDYALRYSLFIQTNGPIKSATLLIYPGEFGVTNNPIVFYNEFFKTY